MSSHRPRPTLKLTLYKKSRPEPIPWAAALTPDQEFALDFMFSTHRITRRQSIGPRDIEYVNAQRDIVRGQYPAKG